MIELILLTIIVLAIIAISGWQFSVYQKHIQKLEEMLMAGNIHAYKELKGEKSVGTPNAITAEPNELMTEGMGDLDISKIASLQIDKLPPRKVKIYS